MKYTYEEWLRARDAFRAAMDGACAAMEIREDFVDMVVDFATGAKGIYISEGVLTVLNNDITDEIAAELGGT